MNVTIKYSVFLMCLLLLPLSPHAEVNNQLENRLGVSYIDIRHTDDLEKLKELKIIRALVVPGRTDFYIEQGHVRGAAVELLDLYEKYLNKGIKKEDQKTRIVYIPVNFDDLIPFLRDGKGDIAVAFLTITEERKQLVNFASSYSRKINELFITHKDIDSTFKTLDDLAGQTAYVLKDSSFVSHLEILNSQLRDKGLKQIIIKQSIDYLTSEDILEMLNAGAINLTVSDDYKANLWAKALPNIRIREDLVLNQDGHAGWAIRKNNPKLQTSLNEFAKTIKKGTLLGNIVFNRHYGRDQKLAALNLKEERSRYSQFIELFKKYGNEYDIDHFKLIAQAYQESGLKQDMRSHRGAVGVMQVLPTTAADKNVNISEIEQLENNIHAGTKYMNFIRTRYFSDPEISRENQIFFSWAAYNAGPANVRKMRNLAEKMGLDKNVWFQNVEVAAGRIIGTETVKYVANIYKYYSVYLLLEQSGEYQNVNQLP
jgi:membrane-bound lytic murein transglycosylase MltF